MLAWLACAYLAGLAIHQASRGHVVGSLGCALGSFVWWCFAQV